MSRDKTIGLRVRTSVSMLKYVQFTTDVTDSEPTGTDELFQAACSMISERFGRIW